MNKFVILSEARSAKSKNLGRAVGETLLVLFRCAAKILRQAQDDKTAAAQKPYGISTLNSPLSTLNYWS